MNEPEPATPAEHFLMLALCQWGNDFPGPTAWLCRLAQLNPELDIDGAIARHADWLNKPCNEQLRANTIACMEHVKRIAAKPPLWDIPDTVPFDIRNWYSRQIVRDALDSPVEPAAQKPQQRYTAALLDPHYVQCIAVMADATDIIGTPHATYVGPAGIHWTLTNPPTSLLNSPCADLPWDTYQHSDTEWADQPPPQCPEPCGKPTCAAYGCPSPTWAER